MTKVRRPYSRVYWEVIDDPKFAHVWDDDRALATWLRLLVAADMAWPASATLPRSSHAKSVAVLVDAGLVDRQAGDRYRIHGLDKERNARSEQAAGAANARHNGMHPDEPPHPASTADGMRPHPVSNAQRMPSQDEQRRAEQRRDEASKAHARNGSDVWDVSLLIEELTGRTPSPKVTEDLRADVEQLGAARVMDAIREVHAEGPGPFDPAGLVYGAHNALFPLPGSRRETPAERKERERQEYLARTRAEMAAAKAAQA